MKKIICILFVCTIFCSCGVTTDNVENTPDKTNNVSDSAAIVSGDAVTVQSSIPTVSPISPEKIVPRTVIDETGKKRKLKLGNINEKDCGRHFIISNPTTYYSQISDGHYYYMRSNAEGDYAVYRDKGELIGKFSIGLFSGYIGYFVKYNKNFYAAFYDHELEENTDEEKYEVKLIQIDLGNGDYRVLQNELWDGEKYYGTFAKGIYFFFYHDSYFFDTGKDMGDSVEYIPGKLMMTDKAGNKTEIQATSNMDKAKPCLTFMDGKIYYGNQKGKTVNLYSFDLKSGGEKRVLSYKRLSQSSVLGYADDKIYVSIDDDYIYCQDYIIPRKGGEMIQLFKDAMLHNGTTVSFSSNSKYIYYVNKNYKIKRFDKRTKQTKIIIDKIKSMDVKCTEKGVYVQKYNKKFMQNDDGCSSDGLQIVDDPRSCDLYYADLDGKNIEKIAD